VSHPAHCSVVGALDIGALVSIYEMGAPRGALSGVEVADISSQETERTSVWIQCIMSTPSNINAQDKSPPVKRCVRSCVWLKEGGNFLKQDSCRKPVKNAGNTCGFSGQGFDTTAVISRIEGIA
jgi:hypothetical protein